MRNIVNPMSIEGGGGGGQIDHATQNLEKWPLFYTIITLL